MSADLRFAHASRADFTDANLTNADAAGADFTGAIFKGAQTKDLDLDSAQIDAASEGRAGAGPASRPRQTPMSEESIRIGVDLGGTKIEAIALDFSGDVLARRRVATPAHDYEEIVRAVAALVREIEVETDRRGTVGVGAPGSISTHSGLVKGSNTQVVNGRAARRRSCRRRWAVRCASRMTPTVLRCRRRSTARGRARAWSSASSSAPASAAASWSTARSADGAQPDRRRMGPYAAAVDDAR